MRTRKLLSILVLLSMVLVALPVSLVTGAPDYYQYGSWQFGPDTAFNWYRHDCTYFDSGAGQAYDQKVYCLGGRPDAGHESDVWVFDPVTGLWTDTGTDMPVAASNYTASVLDDGTANSPGLYTVAGYLVDTAAQINAVQVYYPASNTAVEVTTDPLPALVPGSTDPPIAGGQEAVDGKLYYFGGWASDAPDPYTSVETWVYDPLLAAGSRWSRVLTADMNLGRGYIISAQVDGVIYAIGGDTYDGNLNAQEIVEALDTANLAAGWDDAGVADMPVACDEARAQGFESGANYNLRGQLVVMGCGQWTEQIPESMLYDVAANAWDQSFPDLNTARRNHGGTFIPDLGAAGTPGLWVFGGLNGSPIQSVEYYDEIGPFEMGVKLLPKSQRTEDTPGERVEHTAFVKNETGSSDSFDLAYGGNDWESSGPASVGPVADGTALEFTVAVTIPVSAASPSTDTLWITATAQTASYTDTAQILTAVPPYTGTVDGHIYDLNTGLPLDGFVGIYDANDPGVEFEAWTDASGYYRIEGLLGGDYDIYGAAVGWVRVDDVVSVTGLATTTMDFNLPAPEMDWAPEGISETLAVGELKDVTLVLSNTTGSADLLYRVDEIAPGTGFSPAATEGVVPGIEAGVDARVYEALAEADATVEVLAVMAEQADLSAAEDIADWSARGHYVYNTLKATAGRSQARVQKYLDGQGIAYHSHISLNSLTLSAAASTVEALAAMPEVYAIRMGESYEIPTPIDMPAPEGSEAIGWNIENIAANKVWEDLGITGENIVVANIDTGVEYTHTALVEQYRGNLGGGTFDHSYNWWDPRGACEIEGFPAGLPCDDHSHGTHTMGSMVGSDDPANPISATNGIGVAPGATWIACKGCEDVLGWACSSFALLECADFILAPWDNDGLDPDPDMRPHVVNNSWGGSAVDGWYFEAVAAWRAAGIFPAYSGGNDGPACATAHSPADYYNSFATGAVDVNNNIAGFSSRGPSNLGTFKPQVSAPGVAIRSSVPGNTYANNSGTSMASPHSAGQVALIWSAQPELIGQVQLTEWLMMQTSEPLTTTLQDCAGVPGTDVPNYTYGWGLINAYDAVSEAQANDWDVTWLDVTPVMGAVTAGNELSLDVSLDATDLMTGCYTAQLKIETNDPYQGLDVFVPVDLCVEEAEPEMFPVYLPIVVRNY